MFKYEHIIIIIITPVPKTLHWLLHRILQTGHIVYRAMNPGQLKHLK